MTQTKLSIAICTWNRSDLLRKTLTQMQQLRIEPEFEWELVIVDNNSTDDTKSVIDEFSRDLPIVSAFEPVQGHSQSRNRAVASATGDYIIWTDNDVLVDTDWLVCYFKAFQKHPDAAFFGGQIEPEFVSPPPQWLNETWDLCKGVFATRALGNEEVELTESRLPYGANYAIRADIQRKYSYDTSFGRKANSMIGEDEIAVLRQIAKDGFRGVWVPGANVKHLIPADRMHERYVAKYFVGQGQTNAMLGKVKRARISLLIESLYFGGLYRIKRGYARPIEWVSHLIRSSLSWGEFRVRKRQT